MQIGEVARKAGVAASTIRFYERAGILPKPARTASGYRHYEPSVLERLSFIQAGQSVGLTLAELKEVIAFRERGEVPCVHVLELIRRRAAEISQKIEELERVREDLRQLAVRAETLDPAECSTDGVCHLLTLDIKARFKP